MKCYAVAFLVIFVERLALAYEPIEPPYRYDTAYYRGMPIDHFAFADNRTFDLRYLINDSFFQPGGPIFFYTGNEGDIEDFAQNTGFVWDIAPMFNALVLFAEHRFYGETQPFGDESYSSLANLGYLSTEQALADYAVFARWFKNVNYTRAADSPVVAFGGSYGGMLAAWMRIKYPHIIRGSLAASAPILQFTDVTPCWVFSSIVTRTFANSGAKCTACIKKSWPVIRKLANTTSGAVQLSAIFHLCPDVDVRSEKGASLLIRWLTNIYVSLAMVDYPYPTSFLTSANLPAWPVQVVCSYLTNPDASDADLLNSIYRAISVYANVSGDADCYGVPAGDFVASQLGWPFQECTEMVMPMCQNGSDMFEPKEWNFEQFSDRCYDVARVRPRSYWATTEYGADRLKAASNIIFSNGNLDPWSGGGVLNPIPGADTLIPIYIKNAAHHYDLRGANRNDTVEVKNARQQEIDIISGWLGNSESSATRKNASVLFGLSLLLLFSK